MGLRAAEDTGSRFVAFVDGLVSVIGHADRAGPLRDYCTGLVMPCERKSVEPMAAVTAPANVGAQHQSLLHFVGEAPWSDERVLAKVREMVLPAIERHGPIDAWIIDDTGFPSRGGTRLAWRGNTAANSASRIIVRLQCRCRSPITMRACRWPISCICRKTRRRIAPVGARRVCPRRSASKPSHRSRLSSCVGRARLPCRAAWHCWTPATAPTPICVRTSRRWGCGT